MDETTPGPWSAPAGDPLPPAPVLPTAPTAAGPFPDPSAPVSVVIETAPRKKRTALWVALALVVVAGGTVGAVLALKGDDGPTYSLELAAQQAKNATALSSHMTMSAMGIEYTVDAEVDLKAQRMHMNMAFGGAGEMGLPEGTTMEAIIDIKSKVLYMGTKFFEDLGAPGIDTPWVKITQDGLEQAGGLGSVFDQLDGSNPATSASILDAASNVEEVGMDDVDGEQVKHYRVTVDMAKALEANPSLQDMIDQSGADMPDSLVYEVYITKDNELRRMTFELDLGVAKTKFDQVSHVLDVAPDIQMPTDDEATDILDLL